MFRAGNYAIFYYIRLHVMKGTENTRNCETAETYKPMHQMCTTENSFVHEQKPFGDFERILATTRRRVEHSTIAVF